MPRYKNASLDTNSGAGYQVKASGGQIIGFVFGNTNAAWRYVKLWNVSAAPTVGTTQVDVTIPVPPAGVVQMAGHQLMELDTFNTGIYIAATTGNLDSSSTAPGANDVIVTLWYK